MPDNKVTTPRPFVFVLMPFDHKFNDTYKFGIKGAAEDAGAYAERIDEQIFSEGILDRIYNQINKADVIVADMTGRNANVFYEVGYAHALGKVVLLLTQDANDIPFDLKHHQHTVYSGSIDTLRNELGKKLVWAIKESEKQAISDLDEKYDVSINGIEVPEDIYNEGAPLVLNLLDDGSFNTLRVVVRNSSFDMSSRITHIYLFAQSQSIISVYEPSRLGGHSPLEYLKAHPSDAKGALDKQYRLSALRGSIPPLPPGASETFHFSVAVTSNILESHREEFFRLRLHSRYIIHDYSFKLTVQKIS